MAGRKRGEIVGALVRGRDRFEAWRRSRRAGVRIPEKLWVVAVTLAESHGLSRTATALKLDYNTLKKRVTRRNVDSGSRETAGMDEGHSISPAFIELAASSPATSSLAASTERSECVVEFEDGSGARMRVHLRGCSAPDLVGLCRSFRGSE